MIDILNIAPILGVSVLQPEDAGSNIRRHVFDVLHDDRLFGAGRREDRHCIMAIAVGSLVERARRAHIRSPRMAVNFAKLPDFATTATYSA